MNEKIKSMYRIYILTMGALIRDKPGEYENTGKKYK